MNELKNTLIQVLDEYKSLEINQALIDSREQESLDPFRKFMLSEHIRNLQREIANYKKSDNIDPINCNIDPIKIDDDPIKLRLLEVIRENGSLNYAQFGEALGVSEATIKRRLNELKAEGIIKREGSNKTGYWMIIRA